MKVHTTVTLDKELVDEIKERREPLSPVLNRFLKEYLGPKKADPVEEKKVMELVELCKRLKLSFDEAEHIKEFCDRSVVPAWRSFKEKFAPDYDLYEFIEKRRAVAKLLDVKLPSINTNGGES